MRNVPYEPNVNEEYFLVLPYEEQLQIRLKPIRGAEDYPTLALRDSPPYANTIATICHMKDDDQNRWSIIRWEEYYRWTKDQLISQRPCGIRADLIYHTLKRFMLQRLEYKTFENWKAVAHEYHRVCIEEGIPVETALVGFDLIIEEWTNLQST